MTAADRHLAELGVLVVMVFWAGNFIVVKGAIGILPPVGFTFLRYVLASVTLLALLRWRTGTIRLPHGDILPIALLGVIGFGCYQILWPVALQSIPAGDSALLIATTPVLTALMAAATRADAPNAAKLTGALISFVGVAMVIAAGQRLDLGVSLVGDLLTIAAATCWAIYTVFGARILRRHSPLVATTWAIVAGTLFIAPVGIAQLATSDLAGVGLPVGLAVALLRDPGRRFRQRGRLPRPEAARSDSRHGAPVAGAGARRGPRGDLPRRGDPAGPGDRRRRDPGRRRAAAARRLAGPPDALGPWANRRERPDRATGRPTVPTGPPRRSSRCGPGEPPLAILVDYDGTIALTDVSDTVMAEHVPAIWESEAAAYDAGLMGSRRLMEIEMALVDAPGEALLATAAAQPHDPGLRAVRPARPGGRRGRRGRLGRVRLLHRARRSRPSGVGELPVVTARTTFEGRRASIAFPNGHPTCFVCGTCKRNRVLAHQAAGRAVVFVGDGESDRYAAGYSDLVWAKRALVRICLEAGWDFRRWTEFAEIDAWLEATLAAWRSEPSSLAGAARSPVLLRARGLGRRPDRPAAGSLATAATR